MKNDNIYQMVTDRIIAEMEKGIIPWQKPWNGGECCISHTTGKPYSWLNQLMLGGKVGEWLTFKQCKEEGGNVKRGEKGCPVVFGRSTTRRSRTLTRTAMRSSASFVGIRS